MNVHQFIHGRQRRWQELERFVRQCSRLSLPRVPLEEFRRGSELYREAVADLAFARMRFAGHPVVREIERLVGLAHSVIYQARREKSTAWWRFWSEKWPNLVRASARPIALAAAIFWVSVGVGFALAAWFPVLEALFVSPAMREAMNQDNLWTQSITRAAPQASSRILTNNVSVSILCWALGITFGIGTVWLLIFNGLMLGAIAVACLRAGLLQDLAMFVVAHGSLELPAIWISGGAGILMGRSMVFPGRYARGVELRLAARRSVQILAGSIPMLLIAAVVEAFVSPTDLPATFKVGLAVALAAALLVYIVTAGRSNRSPSDDSCGEEQEEGRVEERSLP